MLPPRRSRETEVREGWKRRAIRIILFVRLKNASARLPAQGGQGSVGVFLKIISAVSSVVPACRQAGSAHWRVLRLHHPEPKRWKHIYWHSL